MGRVVFFDLDKTLIDCHSANNWLWRELRYGNITYFEAVRALFRLHEAIQPPLSFANITNIQTQLNNVACVASASVTAAFESRLYCIVPNELHPQCVARKTKLRHARAARA